MADEITIPKDEYEQRRSSFELCLWVNQKLQEMDETGSFDKHYFERDARSNIKKLIEEAIPLSRLGLYLSTPASSVYLTCFADNRNYDAAVEIVGFDPRKLRVEVTTRRTKDASI